MDELLNKFDMTGIIDVIDFFKPTSIYDGFLDMSVVFISFALPAFLTLAFFARYLEESAKSMAGEAKFVVVITDLFKIGLFITSYSVVGLMLIELVSVFGEKFYEYGSFAVVAEHYADTIEKVEKIVAAQEKKNESFSLWNIFSKGLVSVPGNPIAATRSLTTAAGWLFFQGTVILFIFAYSFLRLAYCIVYCFTYLWGFAVIPLMLSKKLNLFNGWVKTMLCLLIWPIAESMFYGFTALMFESSSQDLVNTYSNKLGVVVLMGNVYILFGITNLVLTALSAAAVFVAFFISMNQSAALGVAAPFIAAATAGANMYQNALLQVGRAGGRNLAGIAKAGVSGIGQSAGDTLSKAGGAIGGAIGNTMNSVGGVSQSMFSGGPSSVGASSAGPSPAPAATPAPSGPSGGGAGASSSVGSCGQANPSSAATKSGSSVGGASSSDTPTPQTGTDGGSAPAPGSTSGSGKPVKSVFSEIPKIGGASQMGDIDPDVEGKE